MPVDFQEAEKEWNDSSTVYIQANTGNLGFPNLESMSLSTKMKIFALNKFKKGISQYH